MKVGTDGVLLGAWVQLSGTEQVLDIGCGTGLISLMLAQRAPQAEIHAVEIDESSAAQADKNISSSPWPNRIKVFHSSIQQFSKAGLHSYDLIVSNPPFFVKSTLGPDDIRNLARHANDLPFVDLLRSSISLLRPNGKLSVILPAKEGREFIGEAVSFGLYCCRMTEVYPLEHKPVERLLMTFTRNVMALKQDKLVIQKDNSANAYTDEYKRLTSEFYQKF